MSTRSRWLGLSVPWLLSLGSCAVDVKGGGGAGGTDCEVSQEETVEWHQAMPVSSPEGRALPELAYDSVRGKTVLFGGAVVQTANDHELSDTWEWDGASWTQRTPDTSPSARSGHVMVYDSVRGVTVLFGGGGGTPLVELSETWEWDGTSWTQRMPTTSPPARGYHAMVYDSAHGETMLFGGTWPENYGDTWLYRGRCADSGCACRAPGGETYDGKGWLGALGAVLLAARRAKSRRTMRGARRRSSP